MGLLVLIGLSVDALAQSCPANVPRVAPDSRYSISEPVSGEFVVTDLATGLMWKRCSEGQSGATCTGTVSTQDWTTALTLANNATHAGFSDWRLPNAEELLSLVETGCASPAINAVVFPATASVFAYWSSTTFAPSSGSAWHVEFNRGELATLVGPKSNNLHVRLVRGGQWLDPFAAEGDAAPDAFSLTAQTGVPLSSPRTSDPISISGLSSVTGIGVTGAAGSSYSINGGTFTNLPGAVSNGDQVRVRHTSAAVLNTPATTTLWIGGVSAEFVTTTLTGAAATITTITAINPPNSQVVGVPYTVSVSVTGSAAPTGTVTVGDGGGNSCTITLPGTNCALSSTTVGAKTITATYAGDTGNAGSVDTESYSITASSGAPVGLQVGAVVLPATSASPTVNPLVTVTFPQAFRSVPVVILQASGEDADPQGLRIRNVTTTGFQLLQVEPPGCTGCNGSAGTHTVHWLAAAPGRYRLEQDSFAPAWLGSALRGAAPTDTTIDWAAIRAENTAALAARAAAPTSATPGVLAQVRSDGVQRVAVSALIALDARFAGAPASSLAVLDGERPVWRFVGCTTLSADCTLEFVGQARDSRYGAVNAYTITLDPSAVKPAASGHVQAGAASLRSYVSEVRDYSNRLYNASINGPDPWHDARIAANSGPAEVSRSFTLPERVAGAVTLTVDLHGGLDFPDAGPDHHVIVSVNGQTVADRWFDGLRPERIEVAVPESLLAASNTLTIRLPRDTGYTTDVVLLEGYSVRYTRQSRMDGGSLAQGRLDPTLTGATTGELLRDGFETGNANPGFSGFALANAPGGTVLWSEVDGQLGRDLLPAGEVRVDNRSSRWLASAPASVQSPTLALPAAPYSLPASLDYLVIAHPLYADALQPLLQLQASRGLSTAVITTEAIYAAHSDHAPDPAAIKSAVQAAKARGARFLLLVGGDSYDYHDYLGVGSQSYLPTEYVAANDYLFHAATDAAYADVDGDRQPDLAMGRLPVRTQAELTRALTSIVARGNTLPQQYLAVAGRSQPGENFALHARASLSLLRQPGQQKAFALADELGTVAAREQARAGLAGSADWISYQGHSSPSRWAFDNLLDVGQLGSVQRSGLPAVVSQWSCWTNAFVLPTQDTMAHALMLRDNRLAATVIGATSLAEDASHLALAVRFFDLVEDGKLREAEQATAGTIGEALQQAGRDLVSREPQHAAAVVNIALFGDPAAPIR
jgi:hypothetical protein